MYILSTDIQNYWTTIEQLLNNYWTTYWTTIEQLNIIQFSARFTRITREFQRFPFQISDMCA